MKNLKCNDDCPCDLYCLFPDNCPLKPKKMEINKSIEVNQEQYNNILKNCKGLIFHRKSENQFFIKITKTKYIRNVQQFL